MRSATPQTPSNAASHAIALGDAAVADAQRQFRRVIGAWASDVLELRRTGLTRPTARPAGGVIAPVNAMPGHPVQRALPARPADCEASGTWQHALTWSPSRPGDGRAAA